MSNLFFNSERRKAINKSKRSGGKNKAPVSLEVLHKMECKACPLNNANVITPKMEPTGARKPLIYILGEAPGADEDKRGYQFVGRSGRFLRNRIPDALHDHIRWNNTVRTRPPKNRTPEWQEIECCRPSIVRDIEAAKPNAIFFMGGTPFKWATGESNISAWRGRCMPVRIGEHECWGFPMWHPAYVIRQRRDADDFTAIFERDLERAIKIAQKRMPPEILDSNEDLYKGIEIFKGGRDDLIAVEEALCEMAMLSEVAIDIETSRLRPYSKGAKILTVAIGTDTRTIAFPMHHRDARWSPKQKRSLVEMLGEFLYDAPCERIAHNTPFELEWFATAYDPEIVEYGVWHDSQTQAYCIDERQNVLSLDALCKLHLGISLKEKSPIDIEDLENEDLEELLWYNGLDTKYEHKIYEIQREIIEAEGLQGVYEEQRTRLPTLAVSQTIGLPIDQERCEQFKERLEAELISIQTNLSDIDEVADFEDMSGATFNPNSAVHLTEVLVKRMGHKCKKTKESPKHSFDEKILSAIDHPVTKLITKYRSRASLKSKSVEAFMLPDGKFIYPDGRLHTVFNSTVASTGRLSSDSPNVQNFPKRRDKWIRAIVVPPPGHVIVSADYGQLEGRVIAMMSKDECLCQEICDDIDMHLFWTHRIAELDKRWAKKYGAFDENVSKLRGDVKNQFTFPLFYGSVPPAIAVHLGISDSLAEKLFHELWDKYPGVLEWQERLRKFYKKHGYVECLTGRRRHGPLSGNKIINTPVQGTASDLVVDAMTRCRMLAFEKSMPHLRAVINIHDDLTFFFPRRKKELRKHLDIIVDTMVNPPYDWAIVPLSIEVEIGDNWAEMKEYGTFTQN